jgi:GT2 family glycosyltransferase
VAVAVCTLSRPESMSRFLGSLGEQDRFPDQLVIVDASRDSETERIVESFSASRSGLDVVYVRVQAPLVGLTRQRNQALIRTETELVAFFDDDILLRPGCLRELEAVHRSEAGTVGVAAYIENERSSPNLLWRLRRRLGIVSELEPGRYTRSGMSIPWSFLTPGEGTRAGDWLPGGATMWRTEVARELGFLEAFEGYGQGEDLEFSLRAGRRGRLLLARSARVLHEHVEGGRPSAFRLGYMAVYNRYQVHRRGLPNRRRRDVVLFAYAWTLDTILMLRYVVTPRHWRGVSGEFAGRLWAGFRILVGR